MMALSAFPPPRQPFGRATEGRRYGRARRKKQPPSTVAPLRAACRTAGNKPRLSGGKHHDHLPPFEPGVLFNLGKFGSVVADAIQEFRTELLVGHLTAAEPQGNFDLVAFLEEPLHRAHLHVVIMIVDHWSELDLLDLDDLLFLARLGGLFLLLVFVFPVIE